MTTVTVSPKYQVVIPKDVRDAMGIKPGEQFQVFHVEGRIELVPTRPIREHRGSLRGIDTTVEREGDRV